MHEIMERKNYLNLIFSHLPHVTHAFRVTSISSVAGTRTTHGRCIYRVLVKPCELYSLAFYLSEPDSAAAHSPV